MLGTGVMTLNGGDLARMLGVGGEEEPEKNFPEAQVREMLADALPLLAEQYQFEYGQVLRYKKGLESGRRTPAGGVLAFVRYEQNPRPCKKKLRGAPLSITEEDCVVAVILPTGALAEYRTCSRYLEPAPESTETAE